MKFLDELLLGVVQGLTEFLPVSSSGHLKALEMRLDSPLASDLSFDIFVHLATLIAVGWVFRDDFRRLIRGLIPRHDDSEAREGRALLARVAIGAVPAGLVGLFAADAIESLPTRWPMTISICWLVTAGALFSLRDLRDDRLVRTIDTRAALWIGCWQCLALLPGVSRSGITIAAALWWGCRRDAAARFSFLCATPLILGAALLELKDVLGSGELLADGGWLGYAVGGTAALATGYLALRLLLRMLQRGSLHIWAYYLVPLAVLQATLLVLERR